MDAEQRKQSRKIIFFGFGIILCLLAFFIGLHMGHLKSGKLNGFLELLNAALSHIEKKPLAVFPVYDWSYAVFGAGACVLAVLYFYLNEERKDMDRNASGDAKWHTDMKKFNKKYNEPFKNGKKTDGYGNMILAKDMYLSMNGAKTRRNCHQIVFGGSGAGKSYSLVKPNGLQMNCSYVFTDPKGELLEELGQPLEENGYEIKIFNLTEMHKSHCYNPFAYIRDENGVRKMVKCIIDNTRGTEQKSGDPIWEDSMTALLQAICFYMIEECTPEQRNFTNAMQMLRLAQIDENNTSAKSPLDKIFDSLEQKKPESMAVMSYKTFRIGSGNTLKSILITTMTRLDVFNMSAVATLTKQDTLHLEEIGRKRQALFIIIPAEDKTFNFLAATLYTQLFETLYHQVENEYPASWLLQKNHDTYLTGSSREEVKIKADLIPGSKISYDSASERWVVKNEDVVIESFGTKKAAEWFLKNAGGKIVRGKRTLPYDVRLMLDEFANIGKIPGFVEKLSTMRSYKIWCMIILQNIGQLKNLYGDDHTTIIGNCDTFIFLGSQEKEMIEYVSAMLGKTTKRQKSTSLSYGKGGSESFQYTGANLMEFSQIRELDDDDCIIFLKGEKPFLKKKYNYKEHPRYGLSGAASDENKYVNRLDNRKKADPKRDRKQAETVKNQVYEKTIETRGKDKVISEPKETEDILLSACSGDPAKLSEILSMDEEECPETAQTEEEKERAEESFANAKEEIDDQMLSDDLWNTIGMGL